MKLMEYQSRQLLAEFGVSVPEADVADSPEEAAAIQARMGAMVVVKAQVLAGGRGKAGGVRIARTPEEAATVAGRILGLEIAGQKVVRVLVVRAVKSVKEYYLSVLVDRSSKGIEAVFSDKGGITIEEAASGDPGRIKHIALDPFKGPNEADFLAAIDGDVAHRVFEIASSLFRMCVEKGCVLVELNPLSLVEGEKLVALDAKEVAAAAVPEPQPAAEPEPVVQTPAQPEQATEKAARATIGRVQLQDGSIIAGAKFITETCGQKRDDTYKVDSPIRWLLKPTGQALLAAHGAKVVYGEKIKK